MKFAVSGGESSLMVWTPATELVKDVGPEACFLLPIMQRQGGILAAIPFGFFPKAAAKGSFKKSAVIKHCYQTLPKVLLK